MENTYNLTLAAIIAQIVHFAHDDYSGNDSVVLPEPNAWSIAYVVACFVANHTVDGDQGVDTGEPWEVLKVAERMTYDERLVLACELIATYGGAK